MHTSRIAHKSIFCACKIDKQSFSLDARHLRLWPLRYASCYREPRWSGQSWGQIPLGGIPRTCDASDRRAHVSSHRARLESADKFAPDSRNGRRLHRFAQGMVFNDRPQETGGIYHHPCGIARGCTFTRHFARLLASSCRSSPAGSTRLFHAARYCVRGGAAPISIRESFLHLVHFRRSDGNLEKFRTVRACRNDTCLPLQFFARKRARISFPDALPDANQALLSAHRT